MLNRVNNRALRGAFGDDTGGWAGKAHRSVFSMMVEMRGKMVPGLRFRIPPPKHGGQAEITVKPKPFGNGQTGVAAKPKAPVEQESMTSMGPPAQSQTTGADEFDDEITF